MSELNAYPLLLESGMSGDLGQIYLEEDGKVKSPLWWQMPWGELGSLGSCERELLAFLGMLTWSEGGFLR